MKNPLIWMPTLDATGVDPQFRHWIIQRFLRQHGGIGHIITPEPGPWSSQEITTPHPGLHWYYRSSAKNPSKKGPADIAVELAIPTHLKDKGLQTLNSVHSLGPVRRIILIRPPKLALDHLMISLTTLLESLSTVFWIDCHSFGWDATSYIVAQFPTIQIQGVSDPELGQLVRLAALVDRPLVLGDLSSASPKPYVALPSFEDKKNPARVLNSLPLWGRSR